MAVFMTQELIYWHMPKTGGIWIARTLRQVGGGFKFLGIPRHAPFERLPDHLRKGRKVFGSIRDPWSWYASLYQHVFHDQGGLERLRVWGHGSSDFADVLYGMTHPIVVDLEINFGTAWDFGKDEPDHRPEFQESKMGLCSWVVKYIYGHPLGMDIFLDTAQLHKGLGELLDMDIPKSRYPPQNTSSHRKAKIEWDQEMYDWVEQADKDVISLMGYSEPFKASPQAVLYL